MSLFFNQAKNWKPVGTLICIWVCTLTAGCWDIYTGVEETCNNKDDDRNGLVDDPFVTDQGLYFQKENCGGCNIHCDDVFPQAQKTACTVDTTAEVARCEIIECPPNTHLVGSSFCAPDDDGACLPCDTDGDCQRINPNGYCTQLADGEKRCMTTCTENDNACPKGFTCDFHKNTSVCVPKSGSCSCTPAQADQVFGCWLQSPLTNEQCPGSQLCTGDALEDCLPLWEDVCDEKDNNCNGKVDDDFLVNGQYLSNDHCGSCNHPCVPPAPNMVSNCELLQNTPTCQAECLPNFMDLDQVALNGCECELTAIDWPPTALGTDGDCDGELDSITDYIFVSKNGDDQNPGTLELPVLTINQGIALAGPEQLTVFVAQGIFNEQVLIANGVSVFGGYRSDFKKRDLELFTTIIQPNQSTDSYPTFIANQITEATIIGGFSIMGASASTPGTGATAVLFSGSDRSLKFRNSVITAGDGQDGLDGLSSSEILSDMGVESLAQLDGKPGKDGDDGFDSNTQTCSGQTGDGGAAGKRTCPLSGNNVNGGKGGDANCPNTGCNLTSPCGNSGCTDFMDGDDCDFDAVLDLAIENPTAEDGQGPNGGRAGEVTYDSPTTKVGFNYCEDNPTLRREGDDGENGGDGEPGHRGEGSQDENGIFDMSTGLWHSTSGSNGGDGTDGSGAGGGTSGAGYDVLTAVNITNTDRLPGAGGGGGSGGCGAPGGYQGMGGGSSIGLAVILPFDNDGPQISNVRIVPGNAGKGGNGGLGAPGGISGTGGLGGDGNFWCARRGGKGGNGGTGGSGGGGGGGSGGSISGIHVVTAAPANVEDYMETLIENNFVEALPSPGKGGNGGYSPNNAGTDGLDGTAVQFRIFAAPGK